MKTVVFVCFTPYQLINAFYYGNRLEGTAKRVLIWHNYTKYDIKTDRFSKAFDKVCEISNLYEEPFVKRQFHKCLYGGWLFRLSKINRTIRHECGKNMVMCIFSDQHIITNRILDFYKNDINETILIEEGMATYLLCERKVKKTKDWYLNRLLGVHYEPYIGAHKAIKTVFVKHPKVLPSEKSVGRNVILQNNVFRDGIWTKVFEDVLEKIHIEKDSGKKRILWLGQPIEMDGVSSEQQIQWLESVCAGTEKDCQVFVKAHPREENGKYKKLVERTSLVQVQLGELNWVPVEILAKLIKPDIVMTAYSTAANNLLELGLNCKVIYCYSAFGLEINNMAEKLTNSKNVYSVKDVDQLKEVVFDRPLYDEKAELINEDCDLKYMFNQLEK